MHLVLESPIIPDVGANSVRGSEVDGEKGWADIYVVLPSMMWLSHYILVKSIRHRIQSSADMPMSDNILTSISCQAATTGASCFLTVAALQGCAVGCTTAADTIDSRCHLSNQIKSNQIKSNQIKSNQIKSNQIKSNQIKSNQTKSNQTKWNQMKSNEMKSNQIKSNQIKSNQIKSNQIKSNQIKSNQIKSNQIKSNNEWNKVYSDYCILD